MCLLYIDPFCRVNVQDRWCVSGLSLIKLSNSIDLAKYVHGQAENQTQLKQCPSALIQPSSSG